MIKTREKEIAYFFAGNALENALLLGAEENLRLRTKEEAEAISQKKGNSESFINFIDCNCNPKELFPLFSSFPEGTALCFLTEEDETETVRALSLCSYRLIEMFRISNVMEKLFGIRGEGKVSYCLAVRK